jgi:hypothetical protein
MYIIKVGGTELPTRTSVEEAIWNAQDAIQLHALNDSSKTTTLVRLTIGEDRKNQIVVTNSKRSFFVTLKLDSANKWYVPERQTR